MDILGSFYFFIDPLWQFFIFPNGSFEKCRCHKNSFESEQ